MVSRFPQKRDCCLVLVRYSLFRFALLPPPRHLVSPASPRPPRLAHRAPSTPSRLPRPARRASLASSRLPPPVRLVSLVSSRPSRRQLSPAPPPRVSPCLSRRHALAAISIPRRYKGTRTAQLPRGISPCLGLSPMSSESLRRRCGRTPRAGQGKCWAVQETANTDPVTGRNRTP